MKRSVFLHAPHRPLFFAGAWYARFAPIYVKPRVDGRVNIALS